MSKKVFSISVLVAFFSSFFLVQALCLENQECTVQEKTLRVQAVFNFHLQNSERVFKRHMMPLLEKNNIIFVDDNPDLILMCGSPNHAMFTLQQPHILLDEEESASLSRTIKSTVKNPYTIAIFKNTTLRAKELYNKPMIYHFKLIRDSETGQTTEQDNIYNFTHEEQQKVQSVLWDFYRSAFKTELKSLKEMVVDFDAPRPVDVFFAGNILDEKNPPGMHRSMLLEKLELIKNSLVDKVFVSQKGRLPKNDYLDLLKTSKIVISPWGNGEWCWRDYEAIYSGAVVIKPDTDFVQAVPDLYRSNKYYIACKPDFSDLEEKISYVIENYETLTDLRKNARNLLIEHWSRANIARDLAQAIRQAFENYTSKTI